MSDYDSKSFMTALEEGRVYHATLARTAARDECDNVGDEDLMIALDEAQGAADAEGIVSFVVIKITGERL